MIVSYGKIVNDAFVALALDLEGNPTSVPLNVLPLVTNGDNFVANTSNVIVEGVNIDNDENASDVVITSFINANTGDDTTSEITLISNNVSTQ